MNKSEFHNLTAPVLGIDRHRMGTDGAGITTLVAFYGCPLSCRYCLNPQAIDASYKPIFMTVSEVVDEIKKDELYYYISNGGITFGGGEPLLYSNFILSVLEMLPDKWRIDVETSLNVNVEHLELLYPYIDEYIVDIKDMNNAVYQAYSGRNNDWVVANLKWLVEKGASSKIICRIPIIPGFNSEAETNMSISLLKSIGISKFDRFVYKTNTERHGWKK